MFERNLLLVVQVDSCQLAVRGSVEVAIIAFNKNYFSWKTLILSSLILGPIYLPHMGPLYMVWLNFIDSYFKTPELRAFLV